MTITTIIWLVFVAGEDEHTKGVSALSLKPEVSEDLHFQLKTYRKQIITHFADYKETICALVKEKKVTVDSLRTYLLELPAFTDPEHGSEPLLLEKRKEFEKVVTVNEIFDHIGPECGSFLNFDIYQAIAEKYKVDKDPKLKELDYPNQLKLYIEKHRICEFIKINPSLELQSFSSEKLILKFDLKLIERLCKVLNVKHVVATILGIRPSALQFVSISEGCVIVTFLIPRHITETVFCTLRETKKQEEFQVLPIQWLKCGNFTLYFDFNTMKDDIIGVSGKINVIYNHILNYI